MRFRFAASICPGWRTPFRGKTYATTIGAEGPVRANAQTAASVKPAVKMARRKFDMDAFPEKTTKLSGIRNQFSCESRAVRLPKAWSTAKGGASFWIGIRIDGWRQDYFLLTFASTGAFMMLTFECR